ncbi:TPA: hypothetical protein ACHKWK_005537 [Escherichia coli]
MAVIPPLVAVRRTETSAGWWWGFIVLVCMLPGGGERFPRWCRFSLCGCFASLVMRPRSGRTLTSQTKDS